MLFHDSMTCKVQRDAQCTVPEQLSLSTHVPEALKINESHFGTMLESLFSDNQKTFYLKSQPHLNLKSVITGTFFSVSVWTTLWASSTRRFSCSWGLSPKHMTSLASVWQELHKLLGDSNLSWRLHQVRWSRWHSWLRPWSAIHNLYNGILCLFFPTGVGCSEPGLRHLIPICCGWSLSGNIWHTNRCQLHPNYWTVWWTKTWVQKNTVNQSDWMPFVNLYIYIQLSICLYPFVTSCCKT